MQEMVLRLNLRPGTADVVERVAEALGTSVEAIVAKHLETIRDAVRYSASEVTHEPDLLMGPLKVVISEGLAPHPMPSRLR